MTFGHKNQTVIAESPFATSEIGRRFNVSTFATYGHIFDYDIITGQVALVARNTQTIEKLEMLNKANEHVIIATDNDPQGELIASHIRALTPKALHSRVNAAVLYSQTLDEALSKPSSFNDRLAAEGAYLRVMNLKLKKMHQKQFLTTTSIALAKSFTERGRTNHWINHTIEIDNSRLQLKLPSDLTSIDPIRVSKPDPCTTKSLMSFAAMANITELHDKLQRLYESSCISYFRTDSTVLPSSNHCYKHHVGSGALGDAHFAIHNLTPPTSELESLIYKINESAVTGDHLAVSVETKLGSLVAVDTALSNAPMTPQSEVLFHLAVDDDSYASTIAKHAPKYAAYLFNGDQLNEALIGKILERSQDVAPELLEHGTKRVIQRFLEHDNSLTRDVNHSVRSHDFRQSPALKLPKSLELNHSMGL